jgi:hypothetical protein
MYIFFAILVFFCSYLDATTYFLKENEEIAWKIQDQEAVFERSSPFTGGSRELFHCNCPFPLAALHNGSNHYLGIVEADCWMKSGDCYEFVEKSMNPLQLIAAGKILPQNKSAAKITLTCKASLDSEPSWPPKIVAFVIEDNSAFLHAKIALEDDFAIIKSLSCGPMAQPKKSKKGSSIDLSALSSISISMRDGAAEIWRKEPIKLHPLNKILGANYSIHPLSETEVLFSWPLLAIETIGYELATTHGCPCKKKPKKKKLHESVITRLAEKDPYAIAAKEVVDDFFSHQVASKAVASDLIDFFTPSKLSTATPYERPSDVPEDVWERLKPYFLPEFHPFRGRLDRIFNKPAIRNSKTLRKAGFRKPDPRPFSQTIITEHSRIPNCVFKLYAEDQKKSDAKLLLQRILGANAAKKVIKSLGWEKLFLVPSKWIYPLPFSKGHGRYPKHFILIATKMNVRSGSDNRKKWRNAITPLILRGVYSIVTKVGLNDSLIPSNIPFIKGKHYDQLVFIDTEHYNNWPIPYYKITRYLSPQNQKLWKQLIDQEQVTAR